MFMKTISENNFRISGCVYLNISSPQGIRMQIFFDDDVIHKCGNITGKIISGKDRENLASLFCRK